MIRILGLLLLLSSVFPGDLSSQEYYELRTYHLSSQAQIEAMHSYLSTAYVPTLHDHGFTNVGVFTLINNDTIADKKIFVLTPADACDKLLGISDLMYSDDGHKEKGAAFWMAAHDSPPYDRLEITILKSFELAPKLHNPSFDTPKSQQIYELRSYEGATEELYRKKVDMFNAGGEIDIFTDLGFNAVFYGEVIAGASMPNLMYMTSFSDITSRDEHWQAFREAPAWNALKVVKKYENTVSHSDIYLLHPTDYSDL